MERDTPNEPSQLQTQSSFSSVDYTYNEDQEHLPDSVQSPDQISVISAPVKKKNQQMYCIAMYDYDATAEDELQFEEAQIFKLITKEPHGVDDGWWLGEIDGKIGNFPSLMVEECDENGEPLSEDDDGSVGESAPPVHSPPSVPPGMILPEDLADIEAQRQMEFEDQMEDDEYSQPPPTTKPPRPQDKFEIDLTKGQQKQYGTQFKTPEG